MGKVKQSIQEVEEEVGDIVLASTNKVTISLPDLQNIIV